jgi:hypothetical protein
VATPLPNLAKNLLLAPFLAKNGVEGHISRTR